ncbi:indoleamine 2,3-dioxygenase [Novosphingobium mangrovi (ex Huang et al. 2023)]|uniref:Indoleamine 2,3-dioxygenase n=1 Tax=Novosphingobium mangrovi (ex Huang et al. 2023) TaxID=2976432 RepID=A0ABT2I7P3_9SPHN|nr:indoleamine 2,3-dioxygenase [Novosphingobium mangrovi (ex Huang et al. 2023)]MCT2400835.1 indoleamine 2,3-dioxygenase [Novosphingobium mangrovi (ex Huang et al. 2023)]
MSLAELASYGIIPQRGFLCTHDAPDVRFEGHLADARDVALRIPEFLPAGKLRDAVHAHLPPVDAHAIAALDESQVRMAMVHYSFLAQSYIWGGVEPASSLPATIAVPIVALAGRLGQQPLLQYSGYVLDNWGTIDPGRPIGLDNIYMIQKFAGGIDEAWFVLVHVAIEARAGEALALIAPLIEAARDGDEVHARSLLEQMVVVWSDVSAIFDRMPDQCDPYIYFHRVRPYIHGWKDNPALKGGIVYEGVEKFAGKPQVFRGQTGSQSSIVPIMDALLGVGHAADPLKAYLDDLHAYRPPAHRRFIDDVRAHSTLRAFVTEKRDRELIGVYNRAVQAVADFRSRHLEYAASYINKQGSQSAGNDTEIGTGGTPFMKYLKKHRDETAAMMIPA